MLDVDRALARAYATRRDGDANPARPAAPPPPHFPLTTPPLGSRLRWPEMVLALEAEHGGRFDALADALIEARDRRRCRTLLVTSCHRTEGRSTLVLATARALARRPGRTLILDADLNGPTLARLLPTRPRAGLDDVIAEGLAVTEALVDLPDENLTVLPLQAPVARPDEFLADEGWSTTLGRLRRDFDLILMDGGPLFPGLAGRGPIPSVDAALLAYRPSLTGDRALTRARDLLNARGVPLLGLAETFA